jgi:large subunit ribosomal protein L21
MAFARIDGTIVVAHRRGHLGPEIGLTSPGRAAIRRLSRRPGGRGVCEICDEGAQPEASHRPRQAEGRKHPLRGPAPALRESGIAAGRGQEEEQMFAVMKTGGKQYKVAPNDVLVVEKLAAEVGETVQFNDVLMLGGSDESSDGLSVGHPLVGGAAVQAEVLEQKRGPKTLNLKRRRRKHGSRRLKGHRQYLTTVRITDILASGAEATGVKAATGQAPKEAQAPKDSQAAAEPAGAEA